MKIAGFTQAHNELAKGNLIPWLENLSFCDYIYIWDNHSTDGSIQEYARHDNVVVIAHSLNLFENELICKRILLKKVLKEHPDVDWLVWTDVDTLLDARLIADDARILRHYLAVGTANNVDAYALGHINLWRSNAYRRLDDGYDSFNVWGRKPFWRNNGRLEFPAQPGLHQSQEPSGLDNCVRLDYSLIHMGFATDAQIVERYSLYKSKGQSGRALDRLIDESTLWVEPVDEEVLPYRADYVNDPTLKPSLISLYEAKP